ncbi:MAG: outer membrane protein assembly factor BamC [Rhodocyclaceae bacterium]|jgi:outer membrane protein assembly factor BamC|nr:outer membrane protein assembly factor BamC [Rhodocyclaceae bacterium]
MKRKALLLPVVLGLIVSGCGSLLESKKIDYKSAGKLPPLEIPPDLTVPSKDERYSVPDIGGARGGASYSVYSAERAGQARASTAQDVLPQIEKMSVEKDGSQRWLVVPLPPDKLWSNVKEFWQDIGFIIDVERPEAGVMETDWAENRAKLPKDFIRSAIGTVFDDVYSTAERDKFRTRLEPGATPGTTEIYISHRGMYEVYVTEGKDQTRWQPRTPDPDLEAEMLRRLMVRLGVEESRATTMLATAPLPERAKLLGQVAEGSAVLEVQEPFDRAWRRVGLALDRIGFTVEDRDRSQGVYYVRYVDPENDVAKKGEKGFIDKLMFWRADGPKIDSNARYRIQVKAGGDKSTLQVLTREGGKDTSDTARKILTLLLAQLK